MLMKAPQNSPIAIALGSASGNMMAASLPPSSIVVGTTPTGFTGALDTSVAGQTTVNFTSNAGVGLLPGATATATIHASLAVFPPSPNPVLNQAEIPGYGSVPEDPANPGYDVISLKALKADMIIAKLTGRWRDLDEAVDDNLALLSAPRLHRSP